MMFNLIGEHVTAEEHPLSGHNVPIFPVKQMV